MFLAELLFFLPLLKFEKLQFLENGPKLVPGPLGNLQINVK